MSIRIVNITDITEFANKIGVFRDGFAETRKALHIAILNTVQEPMMLRVPQSTRQRYPMRIDSGNANLRKSLMIYVGQNGGNRIRVVVGSEGVPYAKRVHDMPDPGRSGKPVRWTKPGTGNKFISKPLMDNRDRIPEDLCDEVDAKLRRIGL